MGDRRITILDREFRLAMRTVAEVAEGITSNRDWITELAGAIRPLCEAPVCVAGIVSGMGRPDAEPHVQRAAMIGVEDPAELDAFLAYLREPAASDPMMARFARLPGPVNTRARHELIADRDWYRSLHVSTYRRQSRIDHLVMSMVEFDAANPGTVFGVGLHKRWGEKRVLRRHAMLAEAVVTSLAPLVRRWYQPRHDALTPRQREVLDGFLRGDGEKQIARRLGLTVSGVHFHAKKIYKAFGVSSRVDLVRVASRATERPARAAQTK